MTANTFLSKSKVGQLRLATLFFVLMFSAMPVLAQKSLHVETTVTNITSSNFTYGPVSTSAPTCSAASGGPGCKFVSFDFKGTCETAQEGHHLDIGKCTITGTPTVLFSFSPSGAHDQNGNSTGVCAPFFESLVTTYEDGSTLNANGQGEVCCADDSCAGGFGPPFVTHESTIITGGSGTLAGIKGTGIEISAGYIDGSEVALQEQVWIFPEASHL
jgi:hypothetical protein